MDGEKSIINLTTQTLNEMSKICDDKLIDKVIADFMRSGGIVKWQVPRNTTDVPGENVNAHLLGWYNVENYIQKGAQPNKNKIMVILSYMMCKGAITYNDKIYRYIDTPVFNNYVGQNGIISAEDCCQIATAMGDYFKVEKQIFPIKKKRKL